jgi:hypothetical protein
MRSIHCYSVTHDPNTATALYVIFKGALSAKIVNFCYQKKLSDMIDALIKRVSVTYKCYEMYAHRGNYVLEIGK